MSSAGPNLEAENQRLREQIALLLAQQQAQAGVAAVGTSEQAFVHVVKAVDAPEETTKAGVAAVEISEQASVRVAKAAEVRKEATEPGLATIETSTQTSARAVKAFGAPEKATEAGVAAAEISEQASVQVTRAVEAPEDATEANAIGAHDSASASKPAVASRSAREAAQEDMDAEIATQSAIMAAAAAVETVEQASVEAVEAAELTEESTEAAVAAFKTDEQAFAQTVKASEATGETTEAVVAAPETDEEASAQSAKAAEATGETREVVVAAVETDEQASIQPVKAAEATEETTKAGVAGLETNEQKSDQAVKAAELPDGATEVPSQIYEAADQSRTPSPSSASSYSADSPSKSPQRRVSPSQRQSVARSSMPSQKRHRSCSNSEASSGGGSGRSSKKSCPARSCSQSSSSPEGNPKRKRAPAPWQLAQRMEWSRSPARGGGFKARGFVKTMCWYGRDCGRKECWFQHPNGRRMDETKARRRTPSPMRQRRRRRGGSRRRSRSGSPPPRKHQRRGRKQKSPAPMRSIAPATPPTKRSPHGHDARVESIAIPAVLSFCPYVMQHCDNSVTAEEAASRYSSYLELMAQQTANEIGTCGLVFDLYNPLALLKLHEMRTSTVIQLAKDFVEDVKKKSYTSLRLASAGSGCEFNESGITRSITHSKSPHFAFDPNVNSLQFNRVPPTNSVCDILERLQQQPGFLTASASITGDGIARVLRARFRSNAHAKNALVVFQKTDSKELGFGHVELLEPTPALEALLLPPAMSGTERIAKDADLSAQISSKLDGLLGVPKDITDVLLNQQGSVEMKLDLQILYLRRVHHFCFYSCNWCTDEWELYQNGGAALLRADSATISLAESGTVALQDWEEDHEKRIEEFLATTHRKTPFNVPALPSTEDEPFRSLLEADCAEKMWEVVPGKFQCKLCGKCFKSPEYVRKHFRKVHPEIQETVCRRVCDQIAKEAYLGDRGRPLLKANVPWQGDAKVAGGGA